MNICSFTIQDEDSNGRRTYLSHNDVIFKGQFRMLIVDFIPYQHKNDPIFPEPLQCEDMLEFNLANDNGIIYKSITINGLLKIRSLKKILKHQLRKEGE
jgi:hypothetical protein